MRRLDRAIAVFARHRRDRRAELHHTIANSSLPLAFSPLLPCATLFAFPHLHTGACPLRFLESTPGPAYACPVHPRQQTSDRRKLHGGCLRKYSSLPSTS